MLHQIENAQGHKVPAASEVVELDAATALILAASVNGEANAEAVVATAIEKHSLTSTNGVIIFWSTPSSASVTGKALLRRLFLDGPNLEWGPDLMLTDAPQVHAAAERCNSKIEADVG